MRISLLPASLLLLLAIAPACTRSSNDSLSDASTDPKRGDLLGYYEMRHEGSVYVLGSIKSLDQLRAGKPPPTTPGGFNSQGQAVRFETDNAGLQQRLMAEYEKRHGMSSIP